ncbi:MAG: hypothetical protein WAU77_01040 [Solirubrobacteraceae bacterium]
MMRVDQPPQMVVAARATTIANTASGAPRRENATSDGRARTCCAARHHRNAESDPVCGDVGTDVQPQEQNARVRDWLR